MLPLEVAVGALMLAAHKCRVSTSILLFVSILTARCCLFGSEIDSCLQVLQLCLRNMCDLSSPACIRYSIYCFAMQEYIAPVSTQLTNRPFFRCPLVTGCLVSMLLSRGARTATAKQHASGSTHWCSITWFKLLIVKITVAASQALCAWYPILLAALSLLSCQQLFPCSHANNWLFAFNTSGHVCILHTIIAGCGTIMQYCIVYTAGP